MDELTGEIIINTDASVTVDSAAIKHLVAALGASRDLAKSPCSSRTR